MSYEVDFGGILSSMSSGSEQAFGLVWPGEIAPSQWYRISLALEPSTGPDLPGDPPVYTNPAGTLLTIVSEQYGIQGDGQQFTQFIIRDDSNYLVPADSQVTLFFTVNVIVSPSNQ